MLFRLIALLAFPLLAACEISIPIKADEIYTGGTIYTGLETPLTVDAVAVKDGQIIYTGTLDGAIENALPDAAIIDLRGASLYPGFVDAHAHLSGIGQRELTLNLSDTASIADLQTRVAEAIAASDSDRPLLGRGWIETHWPEDRFPTAADLDAVAPDRPVILIRADGHALVANTAALMAGGVTADTPDPDGGRIDRAEDGTPNGMLIDTAMGLVLTDPSLATSLEDMRRAVTVGAEVYASRGWTGLHNMSVSATELTAMEQLATEAPLPIRVYNALTPDQFETAIADPETGYRAARAIKIYMDGALGSRGALLSAPYSDAPDTSGLALRTEDETKALMRRALENNVQLAIHAIGDLANARVITWYGDVIAELDEDTRESVDPRWRIEHTQILKVSDIERLGETGLIASMQPSHAIGDLHFAPDRLGQDRLAGAYAWQDLTDAGVLIAGGSDAPVEVGDPRIEFYAATVRRDLSGYSGEGWNPDQALSRLDTLRLFTLNPAIASFQETELGTLEPGKRADFTVFDIDLMTAEGPDILTARPLFTIVDGETVWSAGE